MGGTPIRPRPLTDLEAAVVAKLLSASRHDSAEYIAQIPYLRVVATWGAGSPSVDVEVDPGAIAADGVTDGIFANAAVTDLAGRPTGEVIIWVEAGRLSGIEYAWYTDERPTRLPDPDRIDLR
ncbi:hypothetical protein ACWCPQ_14875 [Nocardia sp. NPDC001965]